MPYRLLCASALIALSAISAAARPGIAVTSVNLRAAPDTASAVLGKVPGGSRLDVGYCANGWCAVIWRGRSGHAIATALDANRRVRGVRYQVPGAPAYGPEVDLVPAPGYIAPPVYGPVYGARPYSGYWGPRFGLGWHGW